MLKNFRCWMALWVVACAATAQAQLVGLWQFDGNLNDASGNGNNGAAAGAPAPTFSGDVSATLGGGQSLLFGGGNGRVVVPDSASLDLTGAMTVSAWVKPTGVGFDGIVAKNPSSNGSGANHAGNYELRIDNGTRRLNLGHQQGGVNDSTFFMSTGTVSNGSWHHVAATLLNGQVVRFYIDGAHAGSVLHPGTFGATNTNPLFIGNRADLTTTPFDGNVDNVAIFNQALNAAQVLSLAQGQSTPGNLIQQISPVTATASSELVMGFSRPAANTVDGLGQTTTIPDGLPGQAQGMWLSNGVGFGANPSDPNPQITFDLGQPYDLDAINIFNYNEVGAFTGRGVDQFELLLSNDDFVSDIRSLGTFDLDAAPGNGTNPGQAFLIDGDAQFVRFDILSNQNGAQFPGGLNNVDFNFVGLNEVEFFGTAVVPEPTSVAIWLLAALGAIGCGMLRRRRTRET